MAEAVPAFDRMRSSHKICPAPGSAPQSKPPLKDSEAQPEVGKPETEQIRPTELTATRMAPNTSDKMGPGGETTSHETAAVLTILPWDASLNMRLTSE